MTQNTQVSTPPVNCVLTPGQQQVEASPMEQLPSGKMKQKGQLICFRCQTPGHVAKNCTRATAEQSTASANARKDSSLRVVTSSTLEGSYVYLPATLHKMSRIPKKFASDIVPGHVRLFAANNSEISALGTTTVNFRKGNLELTADVIVSDAIDEVLLGSDWLRKNECSVEFCHIGDCDSRSHV
jgi:hypothetical protein